MKLKFLKGNFEKQKPQRNKGFNEKRNATG